jgi:alkylhydroperoxidase/carboxymuconolactone decarboxylase family protein YurZ
VSTESNIIDEIVAKRGYLYPWQQYMAARDPDFLQRYEQLWDMIGDRAVHLDAATKQLILIGVVGALRDDVALKTQIGRGMRMGITADQILEALEVAFLPGGALTLVHGVKALIDVIDEVGGETRRAPAPNQA